MAAQGSPSFTGPLHFELRQQGNSFSKLLGCGQLQASCCRLLLRWELVSPKQILDLGLLWHRFFSQKSTLGPCRQRCSMMSNVYYSLLVQVQALPEQAFGCWQLDFSWCDGVVWLEIPASLDMCWLRTADCHAPQGLECEPGQEVARWRRQNLSPIKKAPKFLKDFFDALCILVLRRLGWLEKAKRERERFAERSRTQAGVTFCLPCFGASHGGVLQVNSQTLKFRWEINEPSSGDVWRQVASDFLSVLKPCFRTLYQSVLARWAGQITNGLAEECFYTFLLTLQRKIQQK